MSILFVGSSFFNPIDTVDASIHDNRLHQTDNASTSISQEIIRFAVIGDFGNGSEEEAAVAELVKSWNPDFIATVGDNNYREGAADTIDEHIGQFYHEYIYPYNGSYGAGAEQNRFFPALGNHDWHSLECSNDGCSGPHFDYFVLPGNERYYDFLWENSEAGAVHLFMLDSDPDEPDGITAGSVQGVWFQEKLAASLAQWKLVYMHHAPYSSGRHGSFPELQWPYREWGAHAVLVGHDHNYERVMQGGIPYFVNGAGGAGLRPCETPVPGSEICYDQEHGAMLVQANREQITFQFITVRGELIDTHTIYTSHLPTPTPTPQAILQLPAIADAYVNEGNSDANYGDETTLEIDSSAHRVAYLTFDLRQVMDIEIVSARLQLHVQSGRNDGSKGPQSLYWVEGAHWDEMTLAYDNRPDLSTEIAQILLTKSNNRIDLDVTAQVRSHIGQLFSVAIDSDSSDGLRLHSRESMDPPLLKIGYNSGANVPVPMETPVTNFSVEGRVTHPEDDAEERLSDGRIFMSSSDLELTNDSTEERGPQIIGIRFQQIAIPQSASITNAYIEFTVDQETTADTSLVFQGQAIGDAPAFSKENFAISNRETTETAIAWDNISHWNEVGESRRTPNLAAIVQKIVVRPDWHSGNAMVFMISGSGQRTAKSYDGDPAAAPLLHVDYTINSTLAPASTQIRASTPTATPHPTQTPTSIPTSTTTPTFTLIPTNSPTTQPPNSKLYTWWQWLTGQE